jgi:hypothetical protein
VSTSSKAGGLLALAALVVVPAYVSFLLGGRGARELEESRVSGGARKQEAAVAAAIAEERKATALLRGQLAELEQELKAHGPAALGKLRKELASRRKRVKPSDLLILDEALDFPAMLDRMAREAVGEELAGVSMELIKGRRSFIVQLTLPPEPSEPEALAKLADSFSTLSKRINLHWISHIGLKAPHDKDPRHRPIYLEIQDMTPEAWVVLLETFRLPHRQVEGGSNPRRNSSLYRIAGLSLYHSLKVETTLDLWGPERVTTTLRPNNTSFFRRLPAGSYVLRTKAEGELPFLGVLKLRSGHMTKPGLRP